MLFEHRHLKPAWYQFHHARADVVYGCTMKTSSTGGALLRRRVGHRRPEVHERDDHLVVAEPEGRNRHAVRRSTPGVRRSTRARARSRQAASRTSRRGAARPPRAEHRVVPRAPRSRARASARRELDHLGLPDTSSSIRARVSGPSSEGATVRQLVVRRPRTRSTSWRTTASRDRSGRTACAFSGADRALDVHAPEGSYLVQCPDGAQVEELADDKVELTVDVPAHDVHHAVEHASLRPSPGRSRSPASAKAGAMPLLVQRIGRERIYEEAVDSHIGGSFWNAAARARVNPVAMPVRVRRCRRPTRTRSHRQPFRSSRSQSRRLDDARGAEARGRGSAGGGPGGARSPPAHGRRARHGRRPPCAGRRRRRHRPRRERRNRRQRGYVVELVPNGS